MEINRSPGGSSKEDSESFRQANALLFEFVRLVSLGIPPSHPTVYFSIIAYSIQL